jgi:hypothetical protein
VSDDLVARNLLLEQRLQSSENKVARLEERLQLQEEENNQRLQVQEEENQRLTAVIGNMRCGPSWNGKTTDIDIIDNLTRLSPLAVHYNANVTNQFIRDIPEMLWWQKILQPFLNLEDLSILRRTNTFFSLVLGQCVGTEYDTSATGLPHCGESDGPGGGLLGTKSVHGNRSSENTNGQGDSRNRG